MTSAEPQSAEQRPAIGPGLRAALIGVAVVGVAAVLYVIVASLAKPRDTADLAGLNHGSMAKLEVLPSPVVEPGVSFMDADGKPVRLADFHGHPVVLNLWATWCAPCVKEMPTLAALQTAEAAKGVKVVAVSMDTAAETGKAKAFMAAHPPLAFFQDAKYAFMTGMQPQLVGFPTTVLIDRSGMERAIYMSDTDWSSPEAKAVVERLAGL